MVRHSAQWWANNLDAVVKKEHGIVYAIDQDSGWSYNIITDLVSNVKTMKRVTRPQVIGGEGLRGERT